LFLILNGRGAGNFSCLTSHALLADGVLDCIFFGGRSPGDLNLLFKVMDGNHIQDNNVLYLQAEELHIDGSSGIITGWRKMASSSVGGECYPSEIRDAEMVDWIA
jgi:diacylglycerol kinase family enzyme